MLPSLWLNSASSTPPELVVREGEQVLGRSADADICLNETFVSGYHARLNWQNSQLAVLDLGSTNGTLVNGIPVIGWTSLTDGDIIEFGGVEATVRLPPTDELSPITGASMPPPPPEPSSRRQPAIALRFDSDETPNIDDTAGPARTTTNRVFGSRLGPAVSDRTEPMYDQPLTSAVTLPARPPAGVSISEPYESGRYDDFDESDFDFNNHVDNRESSMFDHRGLRITAGTAALVLVLLLAIAALVIYLLL